MDQEVFYKLRDKKTGLFKCKGMWGKWTREGDRWSTVGHVKQHLSQVAPKLVQWDTWEVVEYRFEPQEVGSMTLSELQK